MLGRYHMRRGLTRHEMPAQVQVGIRQDTRKHTRHILRPDADLVAAYLHAPEAKGAWASFRSSYRALLEQRFKSDRSAFDALAELAAQRDVFLGCSCPTPQNPCVRRCHTWLALEFMQSKYPELEVRFPGDAR